MRAVNLIPEETRRGGGAGRAGRSGGAAYLVLGGLAVLVALTAAWALTGRAVSRDRSELSALNNQVATMRARMAGKTGSTADAQQGQQRLETVRALAAARTDWARMLDAVARTLPGGTHLTGLTATTSPSAAPAGGTGGGGAIASSSAGPSVQVSGCSPSQKAVAQLMPRLRVLPDVQGVSLVNSTAANSDGAPGGAPQDCTGVQFQMVLFLAPTAEQPAAPAAGQPAAPMAPAGTATTAAPAATGAAG